MSTRSARPYTPSVRVRLDFRPPLWPDSLFGHLIATAVPGVEEWRDGAYRRTMRLPHGPGIVALTPRRDRVSGRFWLADDRDRATAVARCRHLLDLDADPIVVDAALRTDRVLRPLVDASSGRRVPRTVDAHELALRVVLGQQVSTAAARTHAARIVAAIGEPVDDPGGGLTHLFPTADAVAGLDPDTLAMPATRRRTLLTLARALATGTIDLDAGADPGRAVAALDAVPGVGPWTTSTIAMRALGDPDAFLPGDLGVRLAAKALGLPEAPRALTERAERWRPWRSYAVQYLWGAGDHAINHLPTAT